MTTYSNLDPRCPPAPPLTATDRQRIRDTMTTIARHWQAQGGVGEPDDSLPGYPSELIRVYRELKGKVESK